MRNEKPTPSRARGKRCLIIMGPTAAGKTRLAIEAAHRWDGEVINADSRQIYIGMDIGTDKIEIRQQAAGNRHPTTRLRRFAGQDRRGTGYGGQTTGNAERNSLLHSPFSLLPVTAEGVPHYLIDILSPDQLYSAAQFRADAARIIQAIQSRGKLPIVVGGTGFYIRVLTGEQPLTNVPPDPAFRAWAATQPLEALVTELQRIAPDLAKNIDSLKNRRRVTRMLEIGRAQTEENGRSPLLPSTPPADQFPLPTASCPLPTTQNILKLALIPPPDILRSRIEARVDEQLSRGLIKEVRELVRRYGETASGLQTVGYRQAFPLLRRQASLEETRSAILRAHRAYARRQQTWLKKEPNLTIVSSIEEALKKIESWLS